MPPQARESKLGFFSFFSWSKISAAAPAWAEASCVISPPEAPPRPASGDALWDSLCDGLLFSGYGLSGLARLGRGKLHARSPAGALQASLQGALRDCLLRGGGLLRSGGLLRGSGLLCFGALLKQTADLFKQFRHHLHFSRRGGDGGRAALHQSLLDGVDQLVGGHRGVKAPLAEIHVPARGIGPGAHLFGGAHRAGAGVETDAGKVRAQALAQPALDLLRRTGAVQSGGQLVRLPLGRRVLMVHEVLTHPGLHQFPQLGDHPPVCLAESAA